MGKGCVRFKKLVDLALDVRFAGRELYGGRPRAVASWSREAGDTVLVKTVGRTFARVSVEEAIANYQTARALMREGKCQYLALTPFLLSPMGERPPTLCKDGATITSLRRGGLCCELSVAVLHR